MVDGERIHRTIGLSSEGTTRSQAETFIETARTNAREGRLSLPSRRKTHLLFHEAADQYIDRLQLTNGKNLDAKRREMTKYLNSY